MNILQSRPGVSFATIRPAGFAILGALYLATQQVGVSLDITSGTDSHAATDPHATGEAYDVSVRGLSAQQISDIKDELEGSLGPLFTVLYEVPAVPSDPTLRPIAYVNIHATGPHFHVQKKKGTVFPPDEPRMVA